MGQLYHVFRAYVNAKFRYPAGVTYPAPLEQTFV